MDCRGPVKKPSLNAPYIAVAILKNTDMGGLSNFKPNSLLRSTIIYIPIILTIFNSKKKKKKKYDKDYIEIFFFFSHPY